jgi:hypothetical protein
MSIVSNHFPELLEESNGLPASFFEPKLTAEDRKAMDASWSLPAIPEQPAFDLAAKVRQLEAMVAGLAKDARQHRTEQYKGLAIAYQNVKGWLSYLVNESDRVRQVA